VLANPAFEDATVLALSAQSSTERMRELLAAGAADVLRLPADNARLLARALQAADAAGRETGDAHAHLYRRLFEHNPLPMCLFDDRTLQFLAVSDGAVQQYGWSREELLRMTLRDIRPPELVAALQDAVMQASNTVFHTSRHRRKDGSEFMSQGILQRLSIPGGHVRFAVSRDVTEEVLLAEMQRRTLADYRELVERTADGVFTHRPLPDGTIAYVNPAFVAFLGYKSSDEIVGRYGLDLIHPDEREVVRARMESISALSQASPPRSLRFVGADGKTRWAETSGIAVGYEGAPAVTVIARDLTERRRAEEALRRSEERFAQIFHITPAAISITRATDRRFVEVNASFTELTGYSRAEVVGHTAVELALWDDVRDRDRVLAASREPGGPREIEVRTVDKSGRRHDVLMSVVPIEIHDEPHDLAIVVDISERKRLDEQLRHAQKMEAVGRLAGGVAHDFNNLLTGIRGYAELLAEQLAADSAGRDAAQHILRAALRAASLTSQLLAFTRRQPTRAAVLVLDDEVRQLASLLRRIIGADVALVLDLRAGAARVRADAGQLEQIILNLAVNARDAMPQGGQLTIATAAGADESGRDLVRLSIADNGTGMSEEVRTRMFEPFYTTKEIGRGTGLGLSIVYGIVEQSGGSIDVTTSPGHGTRFVIALPRVEEPLAVSVSTAAAAPPRGSETILLAEDDEDVRDFVHFVLTRAGYRVLVAEDGIRALEVAAATPHAIDLLLSDLVMPRVNGHDLAAGLTALRPSMMLLHMSGYPGIRRSEDAPATAFLQKPFSPEELLRAVREALDRRA
jgi:PAS domain S-box-containing protein